MFVMAFVHDVKLGWKFILTHVDGSLKVRLRYHSFTDMFFLTVFPKIGYLLVDSLWDIVFSTGWAIGLSMNVCMHGYFVSFLMCVSRYMYEYMYTCTYVFFWMCVTVYICAYILNWVSMYGYIHFYMQVSSSVYEYMNLCWVCL